MTKNALGKGIAALISLESTEDQLIGADERIIADKEIYTTKVIHLPIEQIKPNTSQPRKTINEDALEELAESIKSNGILQPILVQKMRDYYLIIAGERRWRAAQIACLENIPVIIKDIDNEIQIAEIAIIENLQREDLNPIEEATMYGKLLDIYGCKQEDLAKRLGKSRSYITNMLRILKLPEYVRILLSQKKISLGHAKILIGREDAESLAKIVIEKSLSVRELEQKIFKTRNAKEKLVKDKNSAESSDIKNLSAKIQESIKVNVKISCSKNNMYITLKPKTIDEFDYVIARLCTLKDTI